MFVLFYDVIGSVFHPGEDSDIITDYIAADEQPPPARSLQSEHGHFQGPMQLTGSPSRKAKDDLADPLAIAATGARHFSCCTLYALPAANLLGGLL